MKESRNEIGNSLKRGESRRGGRPKKREEGSPTVPLKN